MPMLQEATSCTKRANGPIESKTKKAESDSPCAIATKVEYTPLTHFDVWHIIEL